MWAWRRPGPQLAGQLRAPADAAPERAQLQHTTPARERQQAARRGRIPGAQADGEDTTPMQNPRQGEGGNPQLRLNTMLSTQLVRAWPWPMLRRGARRGRGLGPWSPGQRRRRQTSATPEADGHQ